MGKHHITKALENQRIGYLDCLRVFAMLMIIALHSPLPVSDKSNSILFSCVSFFNASGLTLFFMISGALLLSKTYDYRTFLKRRFGKVAWPTLFWSLFYLLDNWLQGKIGVADLTKSILSIPFGAQGNGVLWFMYTLMGLYLITPILSSWLSKASKKDVETILILWCITLLLPLLGEVLPVGEIGNNNILFYLSGYMGYYILGHYLERYYQQIRIACILPLIVIPTIIAIVVKLLGVAVDFYKFFWYLSINIAMMSAFWFLLAKRIFTFSIPKAIYTISKYSFGIYLVHIFIMRRIVWNWNFVTQHGSAFQILTTTILTFVMSYIIVYIISRFPFSKYIIGVK